MRPVAVDICAFDGIQNSGGPYSWLRRLPPRLQERGYDVRVLLFSWHLPERGHAYEALREIGVPVIQTSFRDTESNIRWLLGAARTRPPDVFVANHVTPAYYAARYLKAAGAATVGILRSDEAFYRAITDRFVCTAGPYQVTAAVCVSEYLYDAVARSDHRPSQVRWIPSGTPIPDEMATPPAGVLRLAYLGRLVEDQKQVSLMTQALLRATTEVPGVEATLYGDGAARPDVERLIARAGSSRVRCAGDLPSDEVQRRLLDSHVIVLLSDYEGTPMAVMEGMASGNVPVCLRTRSGIPDLVRDGVTGLLVDDRGDGFVSAIRRLRDDGALWQRLSRNARDHAIGRYSIGACADEWARLIEDIRPPTNRETAFACPARIRLPRTHPGFADHDTRTPSPFARLLSGAASKARRGRIVAGRIRRQLMGQDGA